MYKNTKHRFLHGQSKGIVIFRLPLPADWCRHLHGYGVNLCVMTTAGVHVIAGTEEGLLASVDQESNKTGKGVKLMWVLSNN